MVSNTLKNISKAEKEMEHMVNADEEQPDQTEQTLREARRLTEQAVFSAVNAAETWGKKTINKTNEICEEITL